MSLKRPVEPATPAPGQRPDLGKHYRKIGIGALRAALRYRGEAKNQAYAPADPEPPATRTCDSQAA